ncbi:hypothetical protein BpHYR1_028296 [Brachionus plicatilis]|uniref:Uncharacterized protein n=1 Tax=Brachionus plicatilis TaxID=10195 RepID=A0A3M7S040_BRAPC|nr:hypothetical protein BpHYR1_028296 [Brachionus plicatilis]
MRKLKNCLPLSLKIIFFLKIIFLYFEKFKTTEFNIGSVTGVLAELYQANRTKRTVNCKIEDGPDEAVPAELDEHYKLKLGSFLEYQNEDPEPFADQHPDKKDFDSEKSDNEEKEETQEELVDETKPVGPVSFDHDALVKLCGSRGKRKGVDSIELLDVGESEPNLFFFQNKYFINFFSCVYLSSHTVSPYPLIFSSGLGTGNGMIATQQSAAKVTYGTEILESKINKEISRNDKLPKIFQTKNIPIYKFANLIEKNNY